MDTPSNPSGHLILVVEDQFLIAMEMEWLLTSQGFRVIGPAATVADALALLQGERPDAAVLDVELEGENVSPVAEVLREMRIPFILASAYEQTEDRPALFGVTNVGKPILPARLFNSLSDALASGRP